MPGSRGTGRNRINLTKISVMHGHINWQMKTEISVMYGSEEVKAGGCP